MNCAAPTLTDTAPITATDATLQATVFYSPANMFRCRRRKIYLEQLASCIQARSGSCPHAGQRLPASRERAERKQRKNWFKRTMIVMQLDIHSISSIHDDLTPHCCRSTQPCAHPKPKKRSLKTVGTPPSRPKHPSDPRDRAWRI